MLKGRNNLNNTMITRIKDDSYLEFTNDHKIVKNKEFLDWVLSLRPKDVRDKGISERELKRQKVKIREGKLLNAKVKIVKVPLQLYREIKLDKNN